MLDVSEVRRIVAYNRSVFERFSRALQRRRWADVTRNRGIGHLSLKNTLVHILNVHEAWIVAVAQGRWEIFDEPGRRPAQVRSWAEFRRYEARVWDEVDSFVARLTTARLRRRIKAPWMPGRYTIADAFLQTTIEQAHHLGEVIAAMWQQNWKPPAMTWIENQPRRPAHRG